MSIGIYLNFKILRVKSIFYGCGIRIMGIKLWFFKSVCDINICSFDRLNNHMGLNTTERRLTQTGLFVANLGAGGGNLWANYFLPACVRDWNGERILKKCAKTNACVWSEANAVAMESPTCRMAGHTQIIMLIIKKRIF